MSRFKAPGEKGVQTGSSDHQFERFQAAPDKAHIDTDSKDERSIANRLASAEKNERQQQQQQQTNDNPQNRTVQDPLEPARAHGNEPSRGAKIDAQIQKEEEEILRKKKNI